MIPDSRCNRVYFSAKLPEACPKTYSGLIDILDLYGVPHSLLKRTKDIWCRDYMPIQNTEESFIAFGYRPDYLMDTRKHRATITDGYNAAVSNHFFNLSDFRHVIVDGGNLVHCGSKAIMTTKVFEENPWMDAEELCRLLRTRLDAEIIFLPWDTEEIFGHTDGLVRFIDEDTVLMTNYGQIDKRMAERFRRILKARFKNVAELHYKGRHSSEHSWAYINWLQTDRVLIIPKFGIPEDKQALEQISALMPDYKGRIEMVDATDLICYEGCLNCASWTVFDPKEDLPF